MALDYMVMTEDEAPVTLQQFAEMLDMMRRVVEAGAESARRIDLLEQQAMAQHKLNSDLASLIQKLVDKIEGREDNGLIM